MSRKRTNRDTAPFSPLDWQRTREAWQLQVASKRAAGGNGQLTHEEFLASLR